MLQETEGQHRLMVFMLPTCVFVFCTVAPAVYKYGSSMIRQCHRRPGIFKKRRGGHTEERYAFFSVSLIIRISTRITTNFRERTRIVADDPGLHLKISRNRTVLKCTPRLPHFCRSLINGRTDSFFFLPKFLQVLFVSKKKAA